MKITQFMVASEWHNERVYAFLIWIITQKQTNMGYVLLSVIFLEPHSSNEEADKKRCCIMHIFPALSSSSVMAGRYFM